MSTERSQEALDWKLGSVSTHYESGSKGAASTSTGIGDPGGPSYGVCQFSTNSGMVIKFLDDSGYHSKFLIPGTDSDPKYYDPGTEAFDKKWQELGTHDPKFSEAQINFAKKEYYDQANSNLSAHGMDLSHHGIAVQEAVWSTSVQYGPGGATEIFKAAIKEQTHKSGKSLNDMSDEEIVTAIQDKKLERAQEKHDNPQAKHPLSEAVYQGVKNRITSEKEDLIKLSRHERPDYEDLSSRMNAAKTQHELNELGYRDSHNRPLVEDGVIGVGVHHAVEHFRQDHQKDFNKSYPKNDKGILDRETEQEIHKAVEKKQSTAEASHKVGENKDAENKATQPSNQTSAKEHIQMAVRIGNAMLDAEARQRQKLGLAETQDQSQGMRMKVR